LSEKGIIREVNIPARTIDEVIRQLTEVIDFSRQKGSRLGYFAALYRKVTARVKDGIKQGFFEDGPRMERLDVLFANLYLEALENRYLGKPTPRSWRTSFETAFHWWPIVLQHLLLGINAHINLDLGIAAARACPGESLSGLKTDFDRINQILATLVSSVENELEMVWPMLHLLDQVAGKTDEAVINFSMEKAREHAWDVAVRLAPLGIEDQASQVGLIDAETDLIGQAIRHPGVLIGTVLCPIRLGERYSVSQIIDILK
jgi:uncharacterized protein DUF5995